MKKETLRSYRRKLIAAGFMLFCHAFAPAASGTSASPEAPKGARQTHQSAEQRLWETAVESDKAGAYEAYLRKYPDGRYAAVAKARLAAIEASEQKPANAASAPTKTTGSAASRPPEATGNEPAAPAAASAQKAANPELSAEEELWKGAAGSDNASDYEAYLRQYPNGRHAAAAEARLTSLRPAEPMATAPPPAIPQAPPPAEPYLGDGRTIRLNDQTMTGNFSVDPDNGNVSGRGRIVWSNGNTFEGTMVRGSKEGKGRFVWSNGHSYSGDWANDMPNGKGAILFANGDRYEGEVKNGQASGRGVMSFGNGDRYEGEMQNGKPHGQGVMRFSSGDSYRGAWLNGMNSGRGRYTWANGSYWEGEFRNGQRTQNGQLMGAAPAMVPRR